MTSQSPKTRKIKKPLTVMITVCLLLAVAITAQSCTTEPNAGPNATTAGPAQNSTQGSLPTEAPTQTTSAINQNAIMTGLSIGGVPVAGKTRAEALTATATLADQLLSKYEFSVVVDGAQTRLTAKDLGLTTNLEAVLDQALAYGKTGSADERKQAEDLAKNQGVDLKLRVIAQKDGIIAGLQALKTKSDKAPVDASSTFMPNGYTADGKPFEVDPRKLADTQAVGKNISRPELVKVDKADTPNPLRYLYWQTDHYQKGYIPTDASIARFRYTPEVNGRSLDLDATAQQILAQVEKSGSLTPISAVFKTVEATVKLKDVKNETQLIASWTSSYRSHAGTARNWNVSRMSSFINANTILPGEQWTINKTAGPRNDTTARTIGWKKAAGIENGGYTQQVGGGVCQLGSTTYNAAIRAGLTIVSSTHHTIPSDYIPLGLDATLSTPAPDLILKNDNTRPVYLVSYVNPLDKNVTVEIYGQPVVDPKHGPVILDFTSDNRGTRYGTPTMRTIYNATIAKDDTVLSAENPIYVYAKPRMGTEIQTYKHVYALDGTRLAGPTPFTNHKYPVINGTTYVFGPDPATVTPTPTPPPVTPTPTTPPPATPAA